MPKYSTIQHSLTKCPPHAPSRHWINDLTTRRPSQCDHSVGRCAVVYPAVSSNHHLPDTTEMEQRKGCLSGQEACRKSAPFVFDDEVQVNYCLSPSGKVTLKSFDCKRPIHRTKARTVYPLYSTLMSCPAHEFAFLVSSCESRISAMHISK